MRRSAKSFRRRLRRRSERVMGEESMRASLNSLSLSCYLFAVFMYNCCCCCCCCWLRCRCCCRCFLPVSTTLHCDVDVVVSWNSNVDRNCLLLSTSSRTQETLFLSLCTANCTQKLYTKLFRVCLFLVLTASLSLSLYGSVFIFFLVVLVW